MKVIIKEATVEYLSDYDKGWKFSSGDPFKYPVILNNSPCFIKRFEKSADRISGWNLLTNLKRKNEEGLAIIYDVVPDTEKGKAVFYLFYQYAEGRTLNEVDSLRSSAEIKRLGEDLLTGFISLFRYQHWFPDFCDRNILWNNHGRFLFIDLDSTEPFSKMPDREMYGSKTFWVPVVEYYKQVQQLHDFSPGMIHGSSFNILQLLFFVLDARLKLYFKSTGKMGDSGMAYEQYPAMLAALIPGTKNFFNKLLENGSNRFPVKNKDDVKPAQSADELKDIQHNNNEIKSMIEEIANAGNDSISRFIAPPPKPVIRQFTTSASAVAKQESFTLSWQVDYSKKIELYRNNGLYRTIENGETSVTLTEFLDDDKEVSYHLVAINGSQETTSQPVSIRLKRKVKWLYPLIAAGVVVAVIAGGIYFATAQRLRFAPVERIVYEDSVFHISVTGKEKIINGMTVFFNGIQSRGTSYLDKQLIAKVPQLANVEGQPVHVEVRDADSKSLFSLSAEYVPFNVKGIEQKSVYETDSITFYGENLNHGNTKVSFVYNQKNINAPIITASYDRIVAHVPPLSVSNLFPVQVILEHNSRQFKRQSRFTQETIDLKALARTAEWQSGVISTQNINDFTRFDDPKPLRFPGSASDANGFVLVSLERAENTVLYSALRTHPRWATFGIIKGTYKNLHLKGRRSFNAEIGFIQQTSPCTSGVLFQVYVYYQTNNGLKSSRLFIAPEYYNGQLTEVPSNLFPPDVPDDFSIELRVDTYGRSECDWAAWFEPQVITRRLVF